MLDRPQSFAKSVQDRQRQWALAGNIPHDALEEGERAGRGSWVLKQEFREFNLLRPEWWRFIAGSEHRWARALNSSQCFGVNLFGPLADDHRLARDVLARLLPGRKVDDADEVVVHFEHTPAGAREWLGERGQPTQVDVFFEVIRKGQPVGFVLVEVKFTESEFGSCRGWTGKEIKGNDKGGWSNPHRERCQDLSEILVSPASQCWLVANHGRRYWDLLRLKTSTIKLERVPNHDACPFRTGLYQLMRNRVLADALTIEFPGTWSELAVCRHADNDVLLQLSEPVLGSSDALVAFQSLTFTNAVRDWKAQELVELIHSCGLNTGEWARWMRTRYF
jgi:hypothetical protein